MDSLTSMRVYLRVIELGSFAAAAKACGMSATMVGKHIQALEDRLKARLLHRTTRRHSLTELGQLYAERAKALLADWEALERSADDLRTQPTGLIRITAPVTFGNHRLTPAVTEFLRDHPDVRIQLTLNDRVSDLFDDGFDLAFRIGPIHDDGLVARPLAPYRMMLCASPGYLARHAPPRTLADLASHNCLGFAPWSHRKQWRLRDPKGNLHTVDVTGKLLINQGEGLRQAALAGAGIVMQPDILLAPDVAAGTLVRVLAGFEPPERPMHLVYPPDRRATLTLSRFTDFAVKRFGP